MTSDWHTELDTLERYVAGRLSDARAWSVEAHLAACGHCRGRLPEVPAPGRELDDRLEAIWAEVAWERDRPSRGPVERLLVAVGVPGHLARLLAATPSLTFSWLLGVVVTLTLAVVAAWINRGSAASSGPMVFLVVAPLLPLAGVAVTFGPLVDPTYEIGLSAPLRSGRLLLVRAVAVLCSTMPLVLLAGVALPELSWTIVAWVLPALALASMALALSTRMAPVWAAGTLGLGWLVGILSLTMSVEVPVAAFGAPTQALAAMVAVAAASFVMRHRDEFDRSVSP